MSPFTLRRTAARVVVLNADRHVLLIQATDPADPRKGEWWEIPGGGMDPHESSADAARRELREETGIVDAEIGPCVATTGTSPTRIPAGTESRRGDVVTSAETTPR